MKPSRLVSLIVVMLTGCGEYSTITSVPCGSGPPGNRRIQVLVQNGIHDGGIPVRYRFFEGSRCVAEGHLGIESPMTRGLDFVAVSVPGSDLIALVEKSRPDVILLIYDLKTRACYPDDLKEIDVRIRDGELLLDRLRTFYPAAKYLTWTLPGNQDAKVR